MHLIDSNVLIDLLSDDPAWATWSDAAFAAASDQGEAGVNPLIYAELSPSFASIDDLESALTGFELARLPLPWEAGFLAGKAFVNYRRDGGDRRSPMPDFYIVAHALVIGLTLVTRDPRRYRRHYPRLKLLAPDTHFQELAPPGWRA